MGSEVRNDLVLTLNVGSRSFLLLKILLHDRSMSRADGVVPSLVTRCRFLIASTAPGSRLGRLDLGCFRRERDRFVTRLVERSGWQHRLFELRSIRIRRIAIFEFRVATALGYSTFAWEIAAPTGAVTGGQSGSTWFLALLALLRTLSARPFLFVTQLGQLQRFLVEEILQLFGECVSLGSVLWQLELPRLGNT